MLLRLHGSRYVDALPDTDQQLENAIVAGLTEIDARYLDVSINGDPPKWLGL